MSSEIVTTGGGPSGGGGEFVLYQSEEGTTRIDVRVEGETVWLSQKQMAELFEKDVRTISEHVRNVFSEGELQQGSVVRNFRITAADGKQYDTQHYNLDVIISVGYRVKSLRGTQFRIWATQRLLVRHGQRQDALAAHAHPPVPAISQAGLRCGALAEVGSGHPRDAE